MNWYAILDLLLTATNIAAFIVLTYWLIRLNRKVGQDQVEGQKRDLKIQLYKYRFEVYKGVNKFINQYLLNESSDEIVYHILYGLLGHIEAHDHKTVLPYSADFREFEEHVVNAKSLFPAEVYEKIVTFSRKANDLDVLLTTFKVKYYMYSRNFPKLMGMIMPVLLDKSLDFPLALEPELKDLVTESAKIYRELHHIIIKDNIPGILEQYVDIKNLDV